MSFSLTSDSQQVPKRVRNFKLNASFYELSSCYFYCLVRTLGIVADSSYCMVTTGMLTSSLPGKMP